MILYPPFFCYNVYMAINTALNDTLVKDILEWAKVDQELRFASKNNGEAGKYLVYLADASHGYRLRTLISEYGYPTEKLIGKEGMEAFWLLVQHQDFDLSLQKKCLENCKFSPTNHAHLLDRVLVNEGKMQMYGTQLKRGSDGKLKPLPIKDIESIDKMRAGVGLPPLVDI